MRAPAIDRHEAPAILRTLLDPEPGPGKALVAIAAAGVDPIDIKRRDGEFETIRPSAMPLDLGGNLAGTIVAPGTARS